MESKITEVLETTVALAEIFIPGDQKRGYKFVSVSGTVFTYILDPEKNDRNDDEYCTFVLKIDLQNTTEWQQANIYRMIKRMIMPIFKDHEKLSDEIKEDPYKIFVIRTMKFSKDPVN